MSILLFLVCAVIASLGWAFGIHTRRGIQRLFGCILVVVGCGDACLGWSHYQQNLHIFHESFPGKSEVDFQSTADFFRDVQLRQGQSLMIHMGEHGRASPGTLWEVAGTDFALALASLGLGLLLLFRHGAHAP